MKRQRRVNNFRRSQNRQERAKLQFIKRQLINSKGAICGICGEPIKNMKDCTVDHIIPIAKGGQTTIENCQLAHFDCNQQKGSKIYGRR